MSTSFGILLRRHRLSIELTQEALAERAGLSGQAIGALERGDRRFPRRDTVQRLADALRLDEVQRAELVAAARRSRPTGTITGGGGSRSTALQTRHAPRHLPASPGAFAGRRKDFTRLTAELDGATGDGVVIFAITGPGGIGKTWLALHWAHRHLDRFPDGQLFVDLRGFSPGGPPLPPDAAVRGFLEGLGVPPAQIPVDHDAQVNLYRSLVAGKRMLIVLDNASNTEQVLPLLPGGSSCTVLVTSRDQLAGLVTSRGARPLAPDLLDERDARELLARRLGQHRLDAEPDAIADLLGCCAGLPLALGIVASRAAAHPRLPVETWVGQLRDAATRLDALDWEDPSASLSAVLSWSFDSLPPDCARAFALVGLAPGPDVDVPAAAHLAGAPADRISGVLAQLVQASLLEQHVPGRYRMHDLVRLYASAKAGQDERRAALERLTDHYACVAWSAERLLDPHRPPITVGGTCSAPPDESAALAWFDAEHANLLAVQQMAVDLRRHDRVWQLAWTLDNYHWRRGYLDDQLEVWQRGLAVAGELADPGVQTLARRQLGHAYARLGRLAEAVEHLTRALDTAVSADDTADEAHTHRALAQAWCQSGDSRLALEHATRARELLHAVGDTLGEAEALNQMGWYAARLGFHAEALEHCQAALAEFRAHDYRAGQASALDTLGFLAHQDGRYAAAVEHYRGALVLCRGVGYSYLESATLDRLGHSQIALGRHDEARDTWLEALELYQSQHRTSEADTVRKQLATFGRDR